MGTAEATRRRGRREGRLPRGLFTAHEATLAGIPRVSFYRMVIKGEVVQLERGIFMDAGVEIDPTVLDLAIACKRFGPDSSIGGLTALFRYGLVEQVPTKIWILVPPRVKRAGSRYRIIRTLLDPNVGVVKHRHYRIASVDRAVVEALRYSTKLGLSTAIRAARTALRQGQTTEQAILRCGTELGLRTVVLRHWDAIIVE